MDNVTHTLFALTLARTPLARAGRGTAVALVLASNAPDIDIVTTIGGAPSYLMWHRGPTHGPLGVVGLGLIVAALVWIARRAWGRNRDAAQDASFAMLVPIAVIGVVCHVLMDLPTSYGTRLLSPFDWHWFAVDWMPIVDVYLLFGLAAGLLFGGSSTAGRRRNAAIVLAVMAANYGVRAAAHQQALALAPRLFGPLLPARCDPQAPDGLIDSWPRPVSVAAPQTGTRCLVELVATPTFLSPFRWRVIAHLSNAYEAHDVNVLEARFRMPPADAEVLWRTTQRYPNVWTPAVWTAASTRLGRTFLGFARLPAARAVLDQTGTTTVRWTDVRFVGAAPAAPNRAAPRDDLFTTVVRIGPDGQVLDERLGP
ncbi:MAG: metal-dependent hydrolase [Acidobacteriota bacterium]